MPSANRGRHPPSHAETRKANHAKPSVETHSCVSPSRQATPRRERQTTQKPCRDAFLRLSQPPGNAKTRKTNTQNPCRDAFLRLSQPPGLRGRRFYSAISRAETRERVSTTFRRTHEYTPRNPDDGRRGQYIRLRCVMIGRSDNKKWEKGNSSSSDSRCATTAAP